MKRDQINYPRHVSDYVIRALNNPIQYGVVGQREIIDKGLLTREVEMKIALSLYNHVIQYGCFLVLVLIIWAGEVWQHGEAGVAMMEWG